MREVVFGAASFADPAGLLKVVASAEAGEAALIGGDTKIPTVVVLGGAEYRALERAAGRQRFGLRSAFVVLLLLGGAAFWAYCTLLMAALAAGSIEVRPAVRAAETPVRS